MTRVKQLFCTVPASRAMIWGVSLFLWAALAAPCFAQESVPDRLNYQGLVYLNDGSNEFDRVCTVEVRIFSSASAVALETPLWAESHAGVRISKGLFNIILGSGVSLGEAASYTSLADVFAQPEPSPFSQAANWTTPVPVYIQLTVDGQTVKVRQQFVAAPYAFHAEESVTALHGMPAGSIMPYAGATVPTGWLLCDGTECSKTQYASLFTVLGTKWGTPADTTKFKLPDMRGRTPVASGLPGTTTNTEGASASGITNHALGSYFGEENHTLTTTEMPSHTHTLKDKATKGSPYENNPWGSNTVPDEDTLTSLATNTAATGGGEAHNNMQPYKAVNFIIKY